MLPSNKTLRFRAALLVLALAPLAALIVPAAQATPTWWQKDGATWTQTYISEAGGVKLHADVLRPAHLKRGAKTPVILSIGPYFNHTGQLGPVGDVPGEGAPYNTTGDAPSNRFQDFIDGTQLIRHGYTYVMVDLRGYGGSTGCQDWAGPGEQADVKAAVRWAASRPWSTGKVGMYGKSYDAMTGVIGEAVQPKGLKAIVSQEPVYDDYDYLYTNGVRFENSLATPALYDGIGATPGGVKDSPGYNLNSEKSGSRTCPVTYWERQAADSNHQSAFWRVRDLAAKAAGHRIPFFLTQGFLENNTKPEPVAWKFFNSLRGPKHAWFGMWDHIRGNDISEGDNRAPQPWFDEVMAFFNHYVKGEPFSKAPTNRYPAVAVETSNGTWRAEQRWPALDSTGYTTALKPGSYTDGLNSADTEDAGPEDTTGAGVWTISRPLAHSAHFSGIPSVRLDVDSQSAGSNLSVDVYDINPKGSALLLSRYADLLAKGANRVSMQMYGNDWLIPAGDRLGVLVTSANDGWWTPTPTETPVSVKSGTITLPFLKYARPASQDLKGYKVPTRLKQWLSGNGSITLPASTITGATDARFTLPPRERSAPRGFNRGAYGVG
jgi:predicted acyl esterase